MPVDGTIELVSNEQQPSSDLTQSNNGNDRRRTIMPDDVIVDVIPDQQQPSLDLTQNNNGNDRSLTSTGVGAQEKFIPITVLLEKVAKMLGVVVCGWVVLVLVQGGMVGTVETKDRGFVTMLFFLVCFRCWRHYCNQDQSLTEATQSLSADYSSIPNNNQQLALPIRYINRLFYCSRLVSAMTSVVLSVMRLASQDFGKKEVANKEFRDFALKVFYGLTLAEALVLLFAEALSFPTETLVLLLAKALSFPIRGNSVELADGPGDGPEDSPEDGPEDRPECYGEAQSMAHMPCFDFNSEGSEDSLPNLRQRRREIPQQKVGVKLSKENAWKRTKVLTTAAGDGIDSVSLKKVMRKKLGYADVSNQIKEERRRKTRARSYLIKEERRDAEILSNQTEFE